jgi:hypothetical protein
MTTVYRDRNWKIQVFGWENGKHTEVDAGDCLQAPGVESAAAQALHLTRRTIIYYSTGAKPIPAYIGLACKGWEAGHRTHAA